MAYSILKAAIQAVIKQNGNNEITGPILQQALLSMINSLGDGYQFKGVATPATNPGTSDQKVFYIASEVGTYSNFGLSVGENEVAVFLWDGSWSKQSTGAASAEAVSQLGQEIETIIGKTINESLSVTSGSGFLGVIPVSIAQGKKFTISLRSTGGFWSYDVLGSIYAKDENNNIVNLNGETDYKNYDGSFTASTKLVSLNFYRSASAIASGTINATINIDGDYAKTSDINRIDSEISSINNTIDSFGDEKIESYNVVSGSPVRCLLPIYIKSGTPFSIFGNIPRGVVSADQYQILLYKNEALTQYESVWSDVLDERFYKTFIKNYDIYAVCIYRGASAVNSAIITIGCNSFIFSMRKDAMDMVYVDASNGSDANDGSVSAPYATFAKAIESTGRNTTIILKGDVIGEAINIKHKENQESLTIIGSGTQKNRIMLGTFIDSATQYQGDVYYKDLSSFPSDSNFHIFQHEIADANTLITDAERHPLQRGREYRCESTMLVPNTSIQGVVDSEGLTFYWDSGNSRLYFKIASGSSLAANPIVIPSGSGIYGNDGSVKIKLINIDTWYCNIDLSKSPGALVQNCGAKFAYAAGGFIWNNSIGVRLENCEASRIFTGTTTGDGFNAHSMEYADAEARHTTCTMVNCWSHDNNDDGYSDHERCECAIYGGLYEYNGKAGVTPSYGSHLTCYNVLSRKNYNGFYYVGEISNTEGGKYGQMICYDCVAKDNTQNYGFAVDGVGNSMKLVSCKSINNPTGYALGASTMAELFDCGTVDDATIKSVGSGAVLTIHNTTLVNP